MEEVKHKRKHRPHKTLRQQEEILKKFYESGMSKVEFSRKYGLGHTTLLRWENNLKERQVEELRDQSRIDSGNINDNKAEYITIPLCEYNNLIKNQSKIDIMLSILGA